MSVELWAPPTRSRENFDDAASSAAGLGRAGLKDFTLIAFLALGSIVVHGYHPFVEDAEIYVPGIKKLLHPALYPYNQGFFASHARLTFFPNLIATSVRITHVSLEWALLAWHFVCIFFFLLGCWKLGRLCFGSNRAAWGGTALVAALLTIPVAGTALYIMDQYLNPRSFSMALAPWILLAAIEKKYAEGALCILLTALIHPLMAVFALTYAALLIAGGGVQRSLRRFTLLLFPVSLFPPVSNEYRDAINSHPYFFLLRWQWYEWLGILGPLLLLWWFSRIAKRRKLPLVNALCLTTVVFCIVFLLGGLAITIPPQFVRFVELQPMRSLQLVYTLLFLTSGGLLAEYALQAKVWRWLTLFAPLAVGMFYAQRQLFPATPHLELPGRSTANPWVDAFLWIRDNTPVDAYFALDPQHMRLPGEDQHGFRAVAERSMLADIVKDSGAVTMFPALAQSWREQTRSEEGWSSFRTHDFARLHDQFAVDWFVLQRPGPPGMDMDCVYQNSVVLVCRLGSDERLRAQ